MKIVQVANFVHETSGGMRTALGALQTQYLALGHEVVLIRPGIDSCSDETSVVKDFMIRGPVLPMTGGYRVIAGRRELKHILRSLRPDVVELSDKSTLYWVPKWCKKNGIACVVFSHERTDLVINLLGWKRFPLIPIVSYFRRVIARSADAIVCASRFAAAEFDCQSDIIHIVPLGVDSSQFVSNQKSSEWGTPFTLVVCARLSPEKNVDVAIEALRILCRSQICQMLVLGDGPLMNTLQEQAIGLPVHFMGHVTDRDTLANLLTFADVVVNLGHVETFGLVSLEALASGTPVIVASAGASSEVVDNTCGQVVDLQPEKIVAAIQHLRQLSREELRIQCELRASNFSWTATGERMVELFTSSIGISKYVNHS
jgi:alpha-1,6-mannosyltransferase